MNITRVAVYGAGGLGKEIRGLIESHANHLEFSGFIDDEKTPEHQADINKADDLVIAVAKPEHRKSIVAKLKSDFQFKPLIHSSVQPHSSIQVGRGSILCAGVRLTVDISIGEFVIINLNATVGHDVKLGNFVSIMPGVNISGNVKIGEGAFIGSGATILQGLSIGKGAIVGAGAVVTKDVAPGITVAGVPARPMKK